MSKFNAHALQCLKAARDTLAAFGVQAGVVNGQDGYSATVTTEEQQVAQAVADIDRLIADWPAFDETECEAQSSGDILESLRVTQAKLDTANEQIKAAAESRHNLLRYAESDRQEDLDAPMSSPEWGVRDVIANLRIELNRRKGDPVTRLHNLCEGFQEQDDEREKELIALWHFSACPFDHCQRCIDDESIIKRIRDRLGAR